MPSSGLVAEQLPAVPAAMAPGASAVTSPTQRTLAECRRRGWRAAVVERWIPQARRRVDVFGFGDVLAVDPAETGAVLIQACSGGGTSTRVRKICEQCTDAATDWLQAGNRIEVWGWKKYRRGRMSRWRCKRVVVTLSGGKLQHRRGDEWSRRLGATA